MSEVRVLLQAPRERQPIDIEALVYWALSRTGRLPWDRARDKELAFDRGVTAKPRTAPPGNWALAEACAGLKLGNNRPLPAHIDPGPDAHRVLAAIRALDPKSASLVLACGRTQIRPDWMEGIEPRQVEKRRSWRRCKGGQSRIRLVWEPCHPDAIRAAHESYTRWHEALITLAFRLRDGLDGWQINGLAAPAEPWATTPRKIA